MIVLDTNVVSQLMRPAPEPRVEFWLAARDGSDIYLTAISEAELRFDAAAMDAGRRRDATIDAIERILTEDFRGRILPFDSPAATAYATIAASRRAAGRPISQVDCQIAAIARGGSARRDAERGRFSGLWDRGDRSLAACMSRSGRQVRKEGTVGT